MGYRLTDAQQTAFVLGGTVPHIDLVQKLQKRGYYVVLIDYLANSPAKPYANEHLQISTLDYEAVLNAAIERKPSLIISVAVDKANVMCCRVSEALSLPHPYSSEMARLIAPPLRSGASVRKASSVFAWTALYHFCALKEAASEWLNRPSAFKSPLRGL